MIGIGLGIFIGYFLSKRKNNPNANEIEAKVYIFFLLQTVSQGIHPKQSSQLARFFTYKT